MTSVAFGGQDFEVTEPGTMSLLRLAKLSKRKADTEDIDSVVALYDVIRQSVSDEDWERFEELATETRADGEALLAFVNEAMVALADRPTSRPSDSSAGPSTTERSSEADSDSAVTQSLGNRGDLKLIHQQARAARSA